MKVSKSLIRFIAIRSLMAVLLFLILAAWAMGSAVGGSPDEDYVLTSIWCGTEGNPPYCRKDPDRPKAMILPIMAAEPQLCFLPGNGTESAECQKYIYGQEISTDHFNTGRYPSGYFVFSQIFVEADVEKSVLKIRFFNALLASFLLVVAAGLNQKKGNNLLISWLCLATPVSLYFIGSVNSSSWTITATSAFVLSVNASVQNWGKTRLVSACTFAAIFSIFLTNSSRSEGKYILMILFLAIIFSNIKKRKFQFPKSIGLLSFIGLAFYLMVIRFLGFSPLTNFLSTSKTEKIDGHLYSPLNLFVQNFIDLPEFILGFFGSWGLGWFEVETGVLPWFFSSQSALLILGFSLLKSGKKHRWLVLILATICAFFILLANQFKFSQVGNDIQPRYFLPFFLGIALIAVANKNIKFPLLILIPVATLSSLSNSIALRSTIRRYTTGQDLFLSTSLNQKIEWWWGFGFSPEWVWTLGSLAFPALCALIISDNNLNYLQKKT